MGTFEHETNEAIMRDLMAEYAGEVVWVMDMRWWRRLCDFYMAPLDPKWPEWRLVDDIPPPPPDPNHAGYLLGRRVVVRDLVEKPHLEWLPKYKETKDMKLTKVQAQELLYCGSDSDLGLTVESDEQYEERRWVSVHELVVKDRDGKFWATTYERGLTEYQDVAPFEYDNEVVFREVEKVPVTTYEYRPVKKT